MASSAEKFRKLHAAYEGEVQRKQHRMGKRVYPVDAVRPSFETGLCSFVRGQSVVWTPSFEVIGTLSLDTMGWLWGWADPSVAPAQRVRVEDVRAQGAAWGIEELTTDRLTVLDEPEAWDLATVAVGLARADAMYRLEDRQLVRFLALFEGPPSRAGRSRSTDNFPASTPPPSSRGGTNAPSSLPPSPRMPAAGSPSSWPVPATDPSQSAREELTERMLECVPYALRGRASLIVATAVPALDVDPMEALRRSYTGQPPPLDVHVLMVASGATECTLEPTPALIRCLGVLWSRGQSTGRPLVRVRASLALAEAPGQEPLLRLALET